MYPYFPEEQTPEVAAKLSELVGVGERNDTLYIHRNGFHRFSNALKNEMLILITEIHQAHPEIYDLFLANRLSHEQINQLFKPGYVEAVFGIMEDFIEIEVTVNMLHDTHMYLNNLPDPAKTVISRYIRYHLSNHLNEFFILTERISGLLKTVQRLYRKDARVHKFTEHFKTMKNILTNTMNKIRRERNYHVHQKRYIDKDLEELESIEFDMHFQISNPKLINSLYIEKTEEYHKHWLAKVKGVNDLTDEMLDLLFAILEQFLFSDQRNFIPPEELRKRR